ncbi:TPA: DNA/RNA non-specific endonuclease, partial [Streptococcus agalactiae]|nr:DNA/RNA non-specific endonuclease [Streptococcus agalactiae]
MSQLKDVLYLFNRYRLIEYQLTGENSNAKNLMTGTQNLNANFEDEK